MPQVTCSNPTVTIIGTQPETLYVQIEHVQEVEMPVDLQVEDEAALPLGYAMGTPMLNPSTVTVEGPASQVKKVTSVVADLSVAGRRESVDLNLPLRAVDDAGKQINGVTVEPTPWCAPAHRTAPELPRSRRVGPHQRPAGPRLLCQ